LLVQQVTSAIEAYRDISENDKLSDAGQADMRRLVKLIEENTILADNLRDKDLNAKELYTLIIEAETLKLLNDTLLQLGEESKGDDE